MENIITFWCMQPYRFKNLLWGTGQKSVYRICCECGKGKWIRLNDYTNLCNKCSVNNKNHPSKRLEVRQKMSNTHKDMTLSKEHRRKLNESHKGENNGFYGKHHSDETLKLQSDIKSGSNHPLYGKYNSEETKIKRSCTRRGINREDFNGFSIRNYVLSESKCIKLNEKFINSDFHHITKSVGIYIPSKLHRHIWHDLKTGLRMGEINLLALQFINGEL